MQQIEPAIAVATELGRGLIVATFTALLGFTLASIAGAKIAYRWDERRRHRESDLTALTSFYATYGQFFATWKLWDACKRPSGAMAATTDRRWDLLNQASNVEGAFESLLVKIASERRLTPRDKLMLGCFREGYQRLRESIREDARLEWWSAWGSDSGMREYRAFKALAEYVAFMLEEESTAGDHRRGRADAIESLLAISARDDFHDVWWRIAESELKLAGLPAKSLARAVDD